MAHMMKIKSGSVGALVDHYERNREGTLIRENVDRDRTHLNYNLRPTDVQEWVRMAMLQHEQEAGRAVRSDANVLFDWVVTLPQDCPAEGARAFFTACLDFLGERYGASNVIGGYVHMDETTPHMHAPILPLIDGKLQASKMVTRADLRTFHGDLGKFVDERLGFHVSIELDEDKVLDRLLSRSAENMREFQAAKDAAKSQIASEVSQEQRRLEYLQRETARVERDVGRLEREIAAAQAAPAHQESLGESRNRAKGIERGNEQARSRIEELKAVVGGLRERFDAAAGKLAKVLTEFADRRRALTACAPAAATELLEHNGIKAMRSFGGQRSPGRRESLEDAMRRAQESARARNSGRSRTQRPRGRGGMER